MAAIGNVTTKDVVIAINQSLSAEVDLEGFTLAAILMPSAWDAAGLTFQAADVTGGTFRDVYDDAGNEVAVSAAASRAIGIDLLAGAVAALRFIKLRSGTTGVPVTQTAARTLTLVLKA